MYQRLKFLGMDKDNQIMTVHKLYFQKECGQNKCVVFAMMDGLNDQLADRDIANDAYWQLWEVNKDLFDCLGSIKNIKGMKRMSSVMNKGGGVRVKRRRVGSFTINSMVLF
jgi:hypothetical protein